MGLTSWALAAVLAVAVAAALAGVLLGWRRMGRPGARRVAARAAALCVLQAGVLALVLVLVNRSLVFFSSWADLAGSDPGGAGRTATARADTAARAGRASAASRVQVLGGAAVPGAGGRLLAVRIRGALSGLTISGQLYEPPGAPGQLHLAPGQPPAAAQDPVLVAFTSPAAPAGSPFAPARLAAAAAAAIRAGRLRPVLLLMLPAAPGCLNVPGGDQRQTLLTQDVPQALHEAFGTRPRSWALLGDTAGGYCAVELALSDPALFAAAAVPRGRYGRPPAAEAGGSQLIREQEDPAWQLRHQPPPAVSLLFAGPGPGPRAAPLAALARPPLRVASAGQAAGPFPLAAALDWIGAAIRWG